jgi:hypothetical protein
MCFKFYRSKEQLKKDLFQNSQCKFVDIIAMVVVAVVSSVGVRAHVALWLTDGTFTLGK